MTAISIKEFTGMVPRQPDHLLPDNAAAYASNCDFSRSVLAPLNDGYLVNSPGGAIRSIYTVDGIYWYTWDTELAAFKSPVIDEVYNRIYFIEDNTFKVAFSPESQFVNGGKPNVGVTWLAGIPNSDIAPVLELVDRTTLADYPAASFEFKVWWENASAQYGVTTIAPVATSLFRRYTFTAPPKPPGTTDGDGNTTGGVPEDAIFVVEAVLSENNKQLFSLNTGASSLTVARTQALPGGVTMTLENISGDDYAINFDWGVVETRAYLYTVQNTWDEESGPSPVAIISPTYLQDVKVTMLAPIITGTQYRPFKQANVYRTYGGPQYIRAGSTTTNVFIDSARTVTTIGVALASLTWVLPPTGMFGLVLAPNGWFAAFKGNTLYMSEPYRPHVWPYSMTFPKAIMGICVGPQGIVVATMEATYIVTGPHPHSANSMELPIPVGGISQRSMCKVDGGVAFLSHDGIVVVQGSDASLDMSQRYFTRATWRSNFGSALPSMALAYHDGFLVAVSYLTPIGFLLEMDEAGGAMTRFDFQYDALMRLPMLDTLYYSYNGSIYRFREGNAMGASWYSKQFISPKYLKLGVGFARMRGSGFIQIMLLADEVLIFSQSLDPSTRTKYFRLPPNAGALKWQFRVVVNGPCSLEDMAFAQSPDELKNV
jgi:mRNA-degrading endonuclease toxin of MazEF toxin-antitoxin module